MARRVFLIVFDSFGIGEEPDACLWGDEGLNTPCLCATNPGFAIHDLIRLDLLNTEGALDCSCQHGLRPSDTMTGSLIVYVSADGVLRIADHMDVVVQETLYEYCATACRLIASEYVGARVMVRPFEGEWPHRLTERRHDSSLEPTDTTVPDTFAGEDKDVLVVDKVFDLLIGCGPTDHVSTADNSDGIEKTIAWVDCDRCGLCPTSLVDTYMVYGSCSDVDGYAKAFGYFTMKLLEMEAALTEDGLMMTCADRGFGLVTPSTDRSRAYVSGPVFGPKARPGIDCKNSHLRGRSLNYSRLHGGFALRCRGESPFLRHCPIP